VKWPSCWRLRERKTMTIVVPQNWRVWGDRVWKRLKSCYTGQFASESSCRGLIPWKDVWNEGHFRI
jgi:hypothetical protein